MSLSPYFLKFTLSGGGTIITSKTANALRTGWALLKRWSMLALSGETYRSRSCSCCWNWNSVDASSRVASLPFASKSYMNCFSGNLSSTMTCSLCLAWLIAGEMWLKFTHPDWNVLLSWERKGRMCLRIYTRPTNLGRCISFSSPQAVASLSSSHNVRINASKSSNMASTAWSRDNHLVWQAFFSFLVITFLLFFDKSKDLLLLALSSK